MKKPDPDVIVVDDDEQPVVAEPRHVDDDNHRLSDLDTMMDTLDQFNVQYTLVQDEAGATIECAAGDRGMKGFAGVTITYNFTPPHDDPAYDEKFMFIGLVRS